MPGIIMVDTETPPLCTLSIAVATQIVSLFIFYIINNLFILNKDKILNKFDNKFIKLYIKYQSFLAKLSLIYLPIFILVGLLILCHGFYFLIKL